MKVHLRGGGVLRGETGRLETGVIGLILTGGVWRRRRRRRGRRVCGVFGGKKQIKTGKETEKLESFNYIIISRKIYF